MKLSNYLIHPLLAGYIKKLWVLENDQTLPHSDLHIIVPNGLVKIVIPFRNGLNAIIRGERRDSATHTITLIGIADIPSVVNEAEHGPSGTIGIEFSPLGAYRFFNFPLEEISNCVLPLSDVMGKSAGVLQERVANAEQPDEKVALVQEFLLDQFAARESDQIFEYCIQKIVQSGGTSQVSELEKLTGYSARWLNMKFHTRIGISPKNLSSIIRFQEIYQHWANSNFTSFDGADIYRYYHDQAHFIKDFKRFTGFPPTKYQLQANDFGRIFYKE